ncbi:MULTISPECIES: outer membrane beta-barrel protein [Pseudomonas]|uniref:outer membrane beta-barrel protein n=1 Tax=Pseudomonas TaxID=286 RepID=UPI00257CA8F2|nr:MULTISPECIES: outer membrane beta-barrel protein [Pseudomonas]
MHNIKVKTLGAVLAALAIVDAHAGEAVVPGEGTLFKSVFGETLERDYGITVSGLIDIGYSRNNRSTSDEREDGTSNLPITGLSDEGLEFGSFHVFIDKPLKAPFVPRITPLPGPKAEAADIGFTFETNYGRNAQFARTFGWDMGWDINEQDAAKAARDKKRFLAIPNIAATAYVPWATGVTVMAGVFGPAMGYEIPPNIRAARNPFASKTYAFVSSPGTVAGALFGSRVMNNDNGILGIELGPVRGWDNIRDNNESTSVLGALRWRSPDMSTWIDYEFIAGNEQNDSTSDVQAPMNRLISSSNQFKQHHDLNGWHQFDEHWSIGAELVYGHQDGDGKASTIDIVTGPGFDGAKWWGANATVTYKIQPDLSFSVRGEHFSDPDGFVQFPTTQGARGDFNAITAGFRYDINSHISIRPELRYDWFDAREHDRPYGNGRDSDRLGAMIETLFYF